MNPKHLMRISELERLSGVPRYTIHFYLREGVLHPPQKTGQTMAYYDESHLTRLQAIKKLKKDLRLPTAFLKERLEDVKDGGEAKVGKSSALSDLSLSPKQKRKQGIIEAAIRLFAQKGYHHTDVRDIAQAAGIATGTFYIYYQNKRDLFVEVVDDVIRSIIGEIADAIRKENDAVKRTVLRARVFYENYRRYSEILNQLRAEITGEDPWAQEKVKKIYWELTQPLIREAQQAIQNQVIRPLDPDLLAFALIGVVEILSLRINLDDKYTFDQITAFMLDILMNGLKPRSGNPENKRQEI